MPSLSTPAGIKLEWHLIVSIVAPDSAAGGVGRSSANTEMELAAGAANVVTNQIKTAQHRPKRFRFTWRDYSPRIVRGRFLGRLVLG